MTSSLFDLLLQNYIYSYFASSNQGEAMQPLEDLKILFIETY